MSIQKDQEKDVQKSWDTYVHKSWVERTSSAGEIVEQEETDVVGAKAYWG